jgi:TPR repeat protein
LNEAIKLYKLAAAQGNAGAQYNLAFMCEQGRGLPLDRVQAAKWYQLAAEGGDALAQYDLGQRYDFGVGVPTNRVEALKWLRLASAQGQADAAERLKTVKAKMSREEIAEAERRIAAFVPRTGSGSLAKP